MAGGLPLPAAKSCILCQQLKPAADFHVEARSPDGLTNKCKDCRRMKQVRFHFLHAGLSVCGETHGRSVPATGEHCCKWVKVPEVSAVCPVWPPDYVSNGLDQIL